MIDLFGEAPTPADDARRRTPPIVNTEASASALAPPRQLMPAWDTLIQKLPPFIRDAALDCAWKTHDEVMNRLLLKAGRVKGMEHATAEPTAFADLSALTFMPLHLITERQQPAALSALRDSQLELHKWMRRTYPDADVALIVGDKPAAELVALTLDDAFERKPARAMVCGPGSTVETVLRAFAQQRSWANANIYTVDDRAGASWNQVPGPKLEKLVMGLLSQFAPSRVLAFEPLQMPATHLLIEKADAAGLPIHRIAAPSSQDLGHGA